MTEPPEAAVWAFDGSKRLAGCDHLALVDAETTLCGVSKNPHGYPTSQRFEPSANYNCKRCIRALRRRGPVTVVSRSGWFSEAYRKAAEAPPA